MNVTFVPAHITPEGDAAIDISAAPADGDKGVSVPKLVLFVTPVIVPVIEEGLIFPAMADVVVGCTCNPLIVIASDLFFCVPEIMMVREVEEKAPCVTLEIFAPVVNPSVGLTPVLNCHPAGAARTKVIVHPPAVLPISELAPSVTVIVPNVVHCGAEPLAA